MALLRLQQLVSCEHRQRRSAPGVDKVATSWLLPSDSATTMVKKRTAPLMSLNQEQLKRNRMEDEVTLDDLWLTCRLGGGTGGPEGRRPHVNQRTRNQEGTAWGPVHEERPQRRSFGSQTNVKTSEGVTFDPVSELMS